MISPRDATTEPVERRWLYIFGLVGAIVVGASSAWICFGAVLEAAGASSHQTSHTRSTGSDIVLAIVAATLLIVCFLVAAHIEHQLRRHHPVAQSWSNDHSPTADASAFGRIVAAHGRSYHPLTGFLYLFVVGYATIGVTAGAVSAHAEANKSTSVQHGGISRTATVLTIKNNYHSSRPGGYRYSNRHYGGYYTADATTSFAPPVNGQTLTTVHYPGGLYNPIGSQLRVLIDPKNPGYAELPGSPNATGSSWVSSAVFALLFACLDLSLGWVLIRTWRHRRSFNRSQ